MNEKTQNDPGLPSSSDSLPSDPLLERLLGAIAKGLDGIVQGNRLISQKVERAVENTQELRKAFATLSKEIQLRSSRTERSISDLHVVVAQFADRVDAVVEHQKTVAGTTVDARRALEDSRRSFDKAVDDITDQLKIPPQFHEEQNAAPRAVREWAVRAANFAWPRAVRHGPAAVAWAVKLVVGSTTLAAMAKIVSDIIGRVL